MLLESEERSQLFTKVIVPLDGSRQATAALPVARTLAALAGATISLVRVVHRPADHFAAHANEVRLASSYLDEVVRDRLGGGNLPVSTHVHSGDVVEAIIREVGEGESAVIVMATRGHGGVVRAVLGSVASELLSRSPVPVVVVRSGTRALDGVRQILVPIDGSPESEQSLSAVADLAASTGAKVTLLRVVTPSPTPIWALERSASYELGQYVDPARVDRAAVVEASRYVNRLADRFETRLIPTEALATLGEIPKTITEAAEAVKADLIVMHTRAHTGAARAVLGSVADAVVRSTTTPVMLVLGQSSTDAVATGRTLSPVAAPAA
jgi:nucleotide-binding universal stress UspA family protein